MEKEKSYSFNSPKTLADEYRIKHIQNRQSLGLPRERVLDLKALFDQESIEGTFKELSPETQRTLNENYSKQTIDNIVETIINFAMPLLIADKSISLSKDMNKFSLSLRKTISENKNAIDSLLKSFFLDESLKDSLRTQKEKLEIINNVFEQKEMDEMDEGELSSLYDVLLDPSGGLGYFLLNYGEDEDWYKKYIVRCLFLVVKQRKGRPSKIFWKALQIIIYKCLTDNEPKTVSSYIEWAKGLTSTIINESYKRWRGEISYPEGTVGHFATLICKEYGPYNLPHLTAKDVDNSLHSTF